MTPPPIVRLHENDNVAIALKNLAAGDEFEAGLIARHAIPAGHKVAVRRIAQGEQVFKYGNPIGVASGEIAIGDHVHSHNLVDAHSRQENHLTPVTRQPSTPTLQASFQGYRRPDGRVGTRNYVLLAARVNCSATVCHQVAARFPAERLAEFPNVDGIAIATHTTGCALEYASQKHEMLGRVLRGYTRHANVAATLMIGLGCEQTTPEYLRDHHGLMQPKQLVQLGQANATDFDKGCSPAVAEMLTMQAEGGTRATIDKAEHLLETLLARANEHHREPVDAKHLRVALECGGSDAYSGITANPAVGEVADLVIAHGGAAVLSETTEIYGAEHLLTARAETPEVARRLLDKIQWWQDHVATYGSRIDNNPSIGNKAGGLTTITEKSLGAVAKSGSSPLHAVVDYAAEIPDQGLSVMDTPGFDPASVTGKVAGGCNMVLFTTGRGSCFGCKPVPVIKIASNSLLFHALPEDMDLNAGVVLEGESLAAVGQSFFQRLLAYASGEPTCSEKLGLGDHEFVPWTVGPTL